MFSLPKASKEQQAIIEAIADDKNVIVDSVAGSGKTTTILHIASANKNTKILVLTYNAKLKIESRQKVRSLKLQNVEVHSYHAFCVKYYNPKAYTDIGIVNSMDKSPVRQFNYNMIIIDEAQDMNKIYYDMVGKIVSDNSNPDRVQFCLLGDKYQSIFKFNKSDPKYLTLAHKLKVFNTGREWAHLELLTSFRLTHPMSKFINNSVLGHGRIKTIKRGPAVKYIICNAFKGPVSEIFRILKRYKPNEIFIVAPSLKSKRSPVRVLENILVKNGTQCFVPISDESKIDEDIVKGKLVFSTPYQVKGLERPVVMLYNFDASYFKFYNKSADPNKCTNDLYVAMTRASSQLVLIHNHVFDYLPFLRHVDDNCNVMEEAPMKVKTIRDNDKPIPVTDLLRHLDALTVDKVIHMIKYTRHAAGEKINIPTKVKTNSGHEEVAEINGIAIPSIYEFKHKRRSTILDVLKDSRIPPKHKKEYNITKRRVERNVLKIRDFLYLSNLYNAIKTGYMFKAAQIETYDWLESGPAKKAIAVLGTHISKTAQYEVLAPKIEVDKHEIMGRVDVIDGDTLWEIKCVSQIKDEHILQLAIYAYMMNASTGYKNLKYYKLLNVLDGTIVELDGADHGKMVELLVKKRFTDHKDDTAEEFLKKDKNTTITNTNFEEGTFDDL